MIACMIENRMLLDSEFKNIDSQYIDYVMNDEKPTKYVSFDRKTEVMFEDAYEYACEHERREAEPDEEEFTDEEFVEWFFSGSWMKE